MKTAILKTTASAHHEHAPALAVTGHSAVVGSAVFRPN